VNRITEEKEIPMSREELKVYREILMEYKEMKYKSECEGLIEHIEKEIEAHKKLITTLEGRHKVLLKLYKGGMYK